MNLVLICLDTLRADMVHHTGVDFIQTPNLDALARQSVIFDNCWVEGAPTIEMRRCLLTGKRSFPWRYDFDTKGLWPTGRGWHKIPPDQPTLAEVLFDAGYLTGMIADTYHMFKPTQNFTRGFASYEFIRGQESDNYRTGPLSAIDWKQYVKDPDNVDPAAVSVMIQHLLNFQDRREEADWNPAKIFTHAARWVEDNRENQPFFLYLDSFDPHEPWDPPETYRDLYAPDYSGKDYIYVKPAEMTDDEIRRVKALYYGEVTLCDTWIGRLLNKLDELRLLDDTIVMFTSDHGTELLDHGIWHKSAGHLHPYNTQLNWFLRVPGGPQDQRVHTLCQDQDFVPTLLSLLDVDGLEVDGHDMWPAAQGDESVGYEYVITGWANHAAVRDERWNYTVNFEDPSRHEELFDSLADPHEDNDVSADHPDVVARQRARLEQLLDRPLPATLEDKTYPSTAPCRMWVPRRF